MTTWQLTRSRKSGWVSCLELKSHFIYTYLIGHNSVVEKGNFNPWPCFSGTIFISGLLHVNTWICWKVQREPGPSPEGPQTRLLFYPSVVVGHSGVNAGSELLGAAVAPADDSELEEPVVDLAHQWPARVSLWDGDEQRYKKKLSESILESRHVDIPRRRPGSSRVDRHKTCCRWSCSHNNLCVDTRRQRRGSPEPLGETGTDTTALERKRRGSTQTLGMVCRLSLIKGRQK